MKDHIGGAMRSLFLIKGIKNRVSVFKQKISKFSQS